MKGFLKVPDADILKIPSNDIISIALVSFARAQPWGAFWWVNWGVPWVVHRGDSDRNPFGDPSFGGP